MTVELVALSFGAMAPRELARFWARALRWDLREVGRDEIELIPTDTTSFRVLVRPTGHRKVSQNRIHFDLTTASLDDQHGTVAELLTIGATHIDIGQRSDDAHFVL